MFCPRCGCHTGPDGSRFCRGCGFRLDGVSQLLARNGAPESYVPPLTVAPQPPSPRKKGIRKGGKMLFAAFAFFPLFFGFGLLIRDPWPLLVPAFVFFLGLMRILYARIFDDAAPPAPPMLFQSVVHPAPVQPQPVSFLQSEYQPPPAPQANVPTTGNLVAPPSVAEPTTSLLNRR